MKRKDWKTRKLKKNIFDNFFYFRTKNNYFLRKLRIRKNNVLAKKNLVPHYTFYRDLLNSFKYRKNYHVFKFLVSHHSKIVFPNFMIKKKIFNDYNLFLNFVVKNNLNFFFVKSNRLDNITGLNLLLFNKFFKLNSVDYLEKIFKDLEKNDENSTIFEKSIDLKQIKTDLYCINYFFSYNLHTYNLIELYKILVLLNLNILIK